MSTKPRVLFVCLGNICRSPLAEAAFRNAARDAGLDAEADSAGTADYHVGKAPDPRSIAEAAKHGIDIAHYRGRQVAERDFKHFTHVFALDHENLEDLNALQPEGASASLGLLLDAVPGRIGQAVADPYYGEAAGFTATWHEVDAAAQMIVAALLADRENS